MKGSKSEINEPGDSTAEPQNDEQILGPGLDGMGTVTAKPAIDKKFGNIGAARAAFSFAFPWLL